MDELSPESRELIELARPGEEPTGADRERVHTALAARIAAAAVAGASVTAGTTAGAKAAGMGAASLFKIAGLVAVVAGVGAGAVAVHRSVTEPAPSVTAPAIVGTAAPIDTAKTPASAQGGGAADEPEPTESAGDGKEPAESAEASRGTGYPDTGVPSARASAPSTLEEETALLRKAQRAMRDGDPERALDLLDEHDEQYANGVLREERQAARVIALCKAGKVAEARAAAARFLAERPNSPLAPRVRNACSSAGSP
jgi:hypothetical protein